jgi:choline dehydrogenase-like flavoprotein
MAATKSYDYVIVGAGSAGCVLANRLSEDKDVRVCVLEAGGPDKHPYISIPPGLGKLQGRRMFDWGYDTEPVPGINNRVIEAMRGKVVGGSSSINTLAYVRGNRGDYDRWAQKGAIGWSYADVLPYFRRNESFEGGADQYRGGDGPLTVSWATAKDALYDSFFDAGAAVGYPYSEDYNGKSQVGLARGQSTIRAGRRCSAAVAFLRPALQRPNVTLEINALASRVILEGKRAVGVEYLRGNERTTVRAEREVILAGGCFNSPQLLMLSGIGPAEHLREHGIAPLVDLPVGENLQDHVVCVVAYRRKEPGPFRERLRADRMSVAMVQAYLFGKGPATVLPSRMYAFLKTDPGHAVPDIQFFCRGAPQDARLWFPGYRPPPQDTFELRPVLLHPESRGRVRLRSADPRDLLRVHQAFLDTDYDIRTLREGVKLARDLIAQKPMDRWRGNAIGPAAAAKTDQEIDEFLRGTAITAHHPSCTTPMGVGPDAVLDPECRVKGTEALRVADAAAMPDLVSGNINACVLMIAEKAADHIRGRAPLAPALAA